MEYTTGDEFEESEYERALERLHEATLEALAHVDVPELMKSVRDFWTPVLADYEMDRELSSRLERHTAAALMEARHRAKAEKEGLHAYALRMMGGLIRAGLYKASAPPQGSDVPEPPWRALQAPFRIGEVDLDELRIDTGVGRGTATPLLRAEALVERLQQVAGPAGWRVDFEERGGVTTCRLEILGAARTGLAHGTDLNDAASRSLRAAARLFGIGRGLHGEAIVAVEVNEEGHVSNRREISEAMFAAGVAVPDEA